MSDDVAPNKPKPKDRWDKADIVGRLLTSTLIPVGLGIGGFYVSVALQDRAAKQKTAEIAVAVLQSNNKSTPELRAWALGVFNSTLLEAKHPLPSAAQKELATKPLPSSIDLTPSVNLAAKFEDAHLKPERDSFGVWTIGFGHTRGVDANSTPISMEQAKTLLAEDLREANKAIDDLVKVPITLNQRNALILLVRDIGTGSFSQSTLLQDINSHHLQLAPNGFMKWIRVRGKVSPGLVLRRQKAVALWNTPDGQTPPQ